MAGRKRERCTASEPNGPGDRHSGLGHRTVLNRDNVGRRNDGWRPAKLASHPRWSRVRMVHHGRRVQ
jgi:hypothetical protein